MVLFKKRNLLKYPVQYYTILLTHYYNTLKKTNFLLFNSDVVYFIDDNTYPSQSLYPISHDT